MQILFSDTTFLGKPANYAIIDKFVSRSAQPKKEDIEWLKSQGITDIFNFRSMHSPDINYNEETEVKKASIRYHNIPSITRKPTEENIDTFLKEIEEVKQRGGKAHIHCKAGADRTGMYAFIYETINGIKTLPKSQAEWFEHGYHYKLYPGLMEWTRNFVLKFMK